MSRRLRNNIYALRTHTHTHTLTRATLLLLLITWAHYEEREHRCSQLCGILDASLSLSLSPSSIDIELVEVSFRLKRAGVTRRKKKKKKREEGSLSLSVLPDRESRANWARRAPCGDTRALFVTGSYQRAEPLPPLPDLSIPPLRPVICHGACVRVASPIRLRKVTRHSGDRYSSKILNFENRVTWFSLVKKMNKNLCEERKSIHPIFSTERWVFVGREPHEIFIWEWKARSLFRRLVSIHKSRNFDENISAFALDNGIAITERSRTRTEMLTIVDGERGRNKYMFRF